MEIKKADSKGRVTGFSPRTMYHVSVSDSGTITATPVHIAIYAPNGQPLDDTTREALATVTSEDMNL